MHSPVDLIIVRLRAAVKQRGSVGDRALTRLPCFLGEMVLIERLADQSLNYRLAAHAQLGSGLVEFLQHGAVKSALTQVDASRIGANGPADNA